MGTAVGLCALFLAAFFLGPLVSTTGAALAWSVSIAAALVCTLSCVPSALRTRGTGIAHTLRHTSPALVSPTKSALELMVSRHGPSFAPGLVVAHATDVARQIAAVPVSAIVPWSTRHTLALLSPLAMIGLVGLGSITFDRMAFGLYGLFHPANVTAEGEIVAPAVTAIVFEIRFPAYWNRPSVTIEDPLVVEAPPGAVIHVRARPRTAATAGSIQVGRTRSTLELDESGELRGDLIAEHSGVVTIRVLAETGLTIRDATRRELRIVPDRSPEVTMEEPEENASVAHDEAVTIRWRAEDDLAIGQVDLVVRARGRTFRQRLSTERTPPRDTAGTARIVPSSFGAREGDALGVHVEATDRNLLTGPGIGRSAVRTLTVRGGDSQLDHDRAALRAALEAAIAALAERLQWSPPDSVSQELSRPSIDMLVRLLLGLSTDSRSGSLTNSMADRLRRADALERSAYRAPVASLSRRTDHHRALRDELEAQVLGLSDRLGQIDLGIAAALTEELDRIRQEIVTLLRELARSQSDENRDQVLDAIARAEAKLSEVMRQLAEMRTGAPSEFLNADALAQAPTENALRRLRSAVQTGDATAIEAQLLNLQSQIDAMARTLADGREAFAEARFGPRERALSEALSELVEIEAQQRVLLDRTSDRRQRATEQALADQGNRVERGRRPLATTVEQLREALARIDRQSLAEGSTESLDRATARVADMRDAISTGELGQARHMAEEASSDIEALAREIELSQLMGSDVIGGPSPSMQEAERAAAQVLEEIDRSIPNLDQMVSSDDRRQMQRDVASQNATRTRTERLRDRLSEGPDGFPLVQSADGALLPVHHAMERATAALNQGRLVETGATQDEAARGLAALRQALERERSSSPTSSSGNAQDGSDGQADPGERVEIPSADAFHGPDIARRQILDAMREPVAPAHQATVERYYRELLR